MDSIIKELSLKYNDKLNNVDVDDICRLFWKALKEQTESECPMDIQWESFGMFKLTCSKVHLALKKVKNATRLDRLTKLKECRHCLKQPLRINLNQLMVK